MLRTKGSILSYGSPGVGTGNHLAAEMFKRSADLPDLVHIPYRGAGPLLNDLIGSQIVFASLTLTGQVLELHKAGKLRVLAVVSPSRVRGAPDFPTAVEAGFPDLTYRGFFGLFAPKGTPRPILERLADSTRAVLVEEELQRLFVASGFETNLNSSPESFNRTVEEERVRWEPIVKTMGLRVD
jgi:tripartite-type tricarboxylate transporter receptor subunit TctC